ncbi:hypothetical protein CONPUDRAFT_145319 [Coniophora puteana RWD-64-598 SS2]|uniref:Uncharacterized protein n=1 Tax=Coniophora puteana (strain RWD-64-598) TaxID=741705 RepID=A0A5M3MJD5_CONPW|nr:uncharacterized protein CONPUDRAFT_145319 [Coniophora puteana RWD-64-598 SS2]EIW79223.1 hypothetical protein CONPUDRAFT_145319 [Coniophora puteana RWD-64-598 SS2]
MDNPWAVHDDQPPPSPPKLDDQLPNWTAPSWTAPASADAWGQTPAWGEESDIASHPKSPGSEHAPALKPKPEPKPQEPKPELEAANIPAPVSPASENDIPSEDDHQEITIPEPTSPVLPTAATLDGGFGGFESSIPFDTAATLAADDDAWGPPTVVDVDDNWGSTWGSAADREADGGEARDHVQPDEWEAARRERERMDRAVPPELLSSILQRCEEVTSELWPTDKEQTPESEADNWRTKGPEPIERYSDTLNKLLPPERPFLETLPPFAQTGIYKEMSTALRLSRHTPVAMRSPLTRYLDSRGTQRWRGTTTITEEDATPAGWRILEKKPEEEAKAAAAPKKTGWLSYWNRRNPSATSVDSPKSRTSPRSSMDSAPVKSPQPLETTQLSDKAASPTAASPVSVAKQPEQPASTSNSTTPDPPSIDVFPPAAPGPSAVSRFLNRFSRRQSRTGSALALSSDDLEFLDDVPYHGDDGKDDNDWSAMFNKPVVQPAAPTPLPPRLAPPPPPSAPVRSLPASRQASISSLPPPLAPSLSSRSSTPVPLSPISPSSSSTQQSASRAQSPFQFPPPPSNSLPPPLKAAPLLPPPQSTHPVPISPTTPKPPTTQAPAFDDFMDFTDASKALNSVNDSQARPSGTSRTGHLPANGDDFSDFFDAPAAAPPRPATPVRSSNSLDSFRSPSTIASSSSFQSSSSSKPLTRVAGPSRSRLSSLTGFDSPDQMPDRVPKPRQNERGWEFDEEMEELAGGAGDDFNDFASSAIQTPSPPLPPAKTLPAMAHPTSPTRMSIRSPLSKALAGPPRAPVQKPATLPMGMIPPPPNTTRAVPPPTSRTPTLPPPPVSRTPTLPPPPTSRTPTLPPPPGSKQGLIPPPPGMAPPSINTATQQPEFDLLGDAFAAAAAQPSSTGAVRDARSPVSSLSPSPLPMEMNTSLSLSSASSKPAPSQAVASASSNSKGGLSAQDLSFFEGL